MIDIRYHISTIVAMFLMLGLGIIIGSTSGFGPSLIKQQTSTIHGLSDKLDNVLKESSHDHSLMKQEQNAIEVLIPKLVMGKLAGKRVAIIRTGDYGEAVTSLEHAIEAAGGTVTSVTTVTNRLDTLDSDQKHSLLSDLKEPAVSDSDANSGILHALAVVLRVGYGARPDEQDKIEALVQQGIIDSTGDYTDPVSCVVVLGGSAEESASGAEDPLIKLLSEKSVAPSITIVGVEPEYTLLSSIPTFENNGISSVDCIDLPLGQLDVVFALCGEPGAYGVKSTATRLIPVSLSASPNNDSSGES